jgi:hypothetical protein
VILIKNKKHLSEKGLYQILSLKSALNKGLPERLKVAFPHIPTIARPDYTVPSAPLNPHWVSGFIGRVASVSVAPYLAGLIEANGSIAVHDKNSKGQKYRPKILVVFSLADKPLAERLAFITQVGKVYHKADAGYLLWEIQKKEDVKKIMNLINGYMRTPKIEALHRAIN